jgi:hypothetical protein
MNRMKLKQWGKSYIYIILMIWMGLGLIMMTWWGSQIDPFTYKMFTHPNDGYDHKIGIINQYGQQSIINLKEPDDKGPGKMTFGSVDGGQLAEDTKKRKITTNIQKTSDTIKILDKNGNPQFTSDFKETPLHMSDDIYKQIMLDPVFNTKKKLFPMTNPPKISPMAT